jgi:hypothetical protein
MLPTNDISTIPQGPSSRIRKNVATAVAKAVQTIIPYEEKITILERGIKKLSATVTNLSLEVYNLRTRWSTAVSNRCLDTQSGSSAFPRVRRRLVPLKRKSPGC